ncbi:S8 family serine peptidase [Dyadobacter sp. CY343]|uniref:S8 family serine peptidase n=1 Tax=Dyadobacter sp. CY343 TaxID=2907299 RepID=UPI001F386CAA|nr:S8 family serine peptidase [Dyadobacter sp. CY343]
MSKFYCLLWLFQLILCFQALFAQNNNNYKLYLRNGVMVSPPPLSQFNRGENARKAASSSLGRVVIIQFDDIPARSVVQQLKGAGIELLEYIPDNAYTTLIKQDPDLELMRSLHVRSILELAPGSKIDPLLLRDQLPAHMTGVPGKIDVRISYPRLLSTPEVKSDLEKNGFEIISVQSSVYQILEIRLDKNRLQELAALTWVQYIEPIPAPVEPLNDKSISASRANMLSAGLPSGHKLDGGGVVIGIGDYGDLKSHADFNGRILAYTNSDGWHGLHVTGTAAGGGIINEKFKGYAPGAGIVFQPNTEIWRLAPSLTRDFGMVLTSNSYGSGSCTSFGLYSTDAYMLDRQASDLPHLLHTFAAGNSGAISCDKYPTGFGNIHGDYPSAKNVISVGRTDLPGTLVALPSSKGPTYDGRIKPELIAAGAAISSTTPVNKYDAASGTSMSAPAVTGGAALLYQRYRQLHGQQNPKNALIKAVLCNGATDKGLAGPDFSHGFGVMNLLRSVTMLEKQSHFSGTLAHKGTNEFQIQIPAGTALVKVMLYWNDPAASTLADGSTLVNNLDLKVLKPGGSEVLPLVPDPAKADVPAVEGVDSFNNIEQVTLANPAAGTYKLKVTGTRIPSESQEYFVVYDIIPQSAILTYPVGSERLSKGDVIDISWDSYGHPSSTFAISYSVNNGASWSVINAAVPAGTNQVRWTVPDATTTTAKVKLVQNETGIVRESGQFSVMAVPVISLAAVQCDGYAAVQWNAVNGATDYEVMWLKGKEMQSVKITTERTHLFSSLSPDSTYYFSVRPRINGIAGRRAVAISRKPDNGTCAGNISNGDMRITSIVSPLRSGRVATSSSLSAAEPVTIDIRNLDDQPRKQPVEIGYSIGGADAPIHWETIKSDIPGLGDLRYTFDKKADLHNPGTYIFNFFIKADGDPIQVNNTKTIVLRQLPNPAVTLPYLENFESFPAQTFYADTTGLGNSSGYDFFTSSSRGRLRTYMTSPPAYSGSKALILDAENWTNTEYLTGVTGTFNLANLNAGTEEINLSFRIRHLASFYGDSDYIGIQVRGKDTDPWIPVYNHNENQYFPVERGYKLVTVAVSDLLTRNGQQFSSSFQVKWEDYLSRPAEFYSLAIDDIRIYKTTTDIALVRVEPASLPVCNDQWNQEVLVQVRNLGKEDSYKIPLDVTINNSDVYSVEIPVVRAGRDTLYSVAVYSALQNMGDYQIRAEVKKLYDINTVNNVAEVTINTPALVSTFPYLENFENGQGGWQTSGASSAWQFGRPNSSKVKGAASGQNAWKTNLTGPYQNDGFSYLYSPCLDIRGRGTMMLSFSFSLDLDPCEAGSCDVAYVEYSTGYGWMRLDGASMSVNGYNATHENLRVWNIQDYTRWHVSTTLMLPSHSWEYTRLRFVLKGNSSATREGIAIDDIHIYQLDENRILEQFSNGESATQNLTGNDWLEIKLNGEMVAAIKPNDQDLGQVTVTPYRNSSQAPAIRKEHYLSRSYKINASNKNYPEPVDVRLYFTDQEAESIIQAPANTGISKPASAYDLTLTKYSGTSEDGNVANNAASVWSYYPKEKMRIVPFMQGYYAEFKTKDFSEFWFAKNYIGIGTPLPVTIVSFTAKHQVTGAEKQESALLEWKTADEKNFSHFEVEVAADKASLEQMIFTKLGEVPGNADAFRYSYRDINPLTTETRYYRLKLVDTDKSFQYSPIRAVNFNKRKEWEVFPNPVKDKVTLKFEGISGQIVKCSIYDVKGRAVVTNDFVADGTAQTKTINLESITFKPGIYLLKVTSGDREQIFKMVNE